MFSRELDFPTAVTSPDDGGIDAGIDWCVERIDDGETLTVWTYSKGSLGNSDKLEQLVTQYSNVCHRTGRGSPGVFYPAGPVLMAWPDMNDIGKLQRLGNKITALCVVSWSDSIRPWVTAAKPEILGDGSAWERPSPELEPIVAAAMRRVTSMVNHSNTVAAGYEKDVVVNALMLLHEAGYRLDGATLEGWALANGWSKKNPSHLAHFADMIDEGRKPRFQRRLRSDFIKLLRDDSGPATEKPPGARQL